MGSIGGFDTLKLHKEFQYVYNKGKAQHSTSIVLFYLPQESVHKVGFTATKKIGNAVKRNRAKRRMRAMFYELSPNLKEGSYVFVAKAALFDTSYENLKNEFKKTVQRSKAFA